MPALQNCLLQNTQPGCAPFRKGRLTGHLWTPCPVTMLNHLALGHGFQTQLHLGWGRVGWDPHHLALRLCVCYMGEVNCLLSCGRETRDESLLSMSSVGLPCDGDQLESPFIVDLLCAVCFLLGPSALSREIASSVTRAGFEGTGSIPGDWQGLHS